MKSVLAVSLSPTFQKVLIFKAFHEDEVNRAKDIIMLPSGKGTNVARVLQNLGCSATILCQLGGPRIQEYLDLCAKENLSVRYLPVDAEIRTCVTIVNEEKHTSTELVEEARTVREEDSEKFFSLFLEEVGKHDAVIISGTKAKGFAPDLYPRIVRECHKRGIMTILDIKGKELTSSLEEHPTIIKPNLSELCATFLPETEVLENTDDGSTLDKVRPILEDIYRKYGTASVITRGKNDTWVFNGKDFSIIPNIINAPIVNTIGCGDTLTAAMAYKLLEGESLENAVRFGMDCAVKKATHVGQGI